MAANANLKPAEVALRINEAISEAETALRGHHANDASSQVLAKSTIETVYGALVQVRDLLASVGPVCALCGRFVPPGEVAAGPYEGLEFHHFCMQSLLVELVFGAAEPLRPCL